MSHNTDLFKREAQQIISNTVFKNRSYMVQVMLGFGWPSAKQTKETLFSDPAIAFFTSSFSCTLGAATGGFRFTDM